ncbi:MAG: secretin N-terminal domain-containing protein, partial [Planctomycetota bacterium]
IRAPADRVAAAMQFLKQVDVPSASMMSLSDIQTRVQVFRLASLDPEKLIEIVGEMNILEPSTRVRVDSDNNALIVSGSAADRFIIDSLIKRLDGTGRRFEVLPLRRLDPVEVAESITFLMGQKNEDDDQSRRRNFFYGYYGGQQDKKKPKDEFRVAANSRYRQVLLWANEQEMEEVQSLLVKLGELPPPGGSARTLRVIDASATPETYEYLRRLQQQWNRLSPNQLELPNREQFREPNERPFETTEEPVEPTEEEPTDRKLKDGTLASQRSDSPFRFTASQDAGQSTEQSDPANQQADANAPAAADDRPSGGASGFPSIQSSQEFDRMFGSGDSNAEPTRSPDSNQLSPDSDTTPNRKAPPAIRVEVDKDGNLMLSSPDTMALDRLENLMLQISPPKRPYTVFHIEHASVLWMRLNLEDYFEDEEENDDDLFGILFFGFDGSSNKDDNPSGLGKGAKLRFIDDLDTNTLVVSGATNDQLRTIAELIELWDVPEPVNKRKTRFTKLVPVSYGKAEQIAGTIKDAYRDLLSSNDKAFAQGGQNGGAPGGGGNSNQASKSRRGSGSSFQSESGEDGGGTNFSFKGKLSIGIDSVGNTLLVSAEGEPLLDLVVDMIDQLDQAARPQGEVQVVEIPGGLSAQGLQNALRPLGVEAEVTPLSGQGNNPRRNGRGNPSVNTPNGFQPGQ